MPPCAHCGSSTRFTRWSRHGGRGTACPPPPALPRPTESDLPQALCAAQCEPPPPADRIHRHVAHHRHARGDRHRLGALGDGVEGHDVVLAGLIVPDAPVAADRDAVRLAAAAAGARELAHLPRRGIERSEEHTSELQSPCNLVCRLLLEKKKTNT